jgi:microcystin-dependent protein
MTSVIRRDTLLSSHLMPFAGDMKFGFTDFDHIGWLLCDGRTLNVSDYNQLFQIVGYTYGGTVGGATFKLPDMRGRVPGAAGAGELLDDANRTLSTRTKGQHLGEEVHQLTIAEMPRHTHGSADTANTLSLTPITGPDGNGVTGDKSLNLTASPVVTDIGTSTTSTSFYDGLGSKTVVTSVSKTTATEEVNPNPHNHTIGKTGNNRVHNNMQPTLFIGNMFVYSGNFKIGRRRGHYAGQPI